MQHAKDAGVSSFRRERQASTSSSTTMSGDSTVTDRSTNSRQPVSSGTTGSVRAGVGGSSLVNAVSLPNLSDTEEVASLSGSQHGLDESSNLDADVRHTANGAGSHRGRRGSERSLQRGGTGSQRLSESHGSSGAPGHPDTNSGSMGSRSINKSTSSLSESMRHRTPSMSSVASIGSLMGRCHLCNAEDHETFVCPKVRVLSVWANKRRSTI